MTLAGFCCKKENYSKGQNKLSQISNTTNSKNNVLKYKCIFAEPTGHDQFY